MRLLTLRFSRVAASLVMAGGCYGTPHPHVPDAGGGSGGTSGNGGGMSTAGTGGISGAGGAAGQAGSIGARGGTSGIGAAGGVGGTGGSAGQDGTGCPAACSASAYCENGTCKSRITEYDLPRGFASIPQMTLGPDGAVWFTENDK